MSAAVTLTLPEPPSANAYWRHVGTRTLLSAEARQYRADVRAAVWALPAEVRRAWPLGGALVVRLDWYRSARRGDVDNRVKQPLDALTHAGVWSDDSQVVELTVRRHEAPRAGRLVVTINQEGR